MRLRPQVEALRRSEALLCAIQVHARRGTVQLRLIRSPPAPRLIDDIDRVAPAKEELRPPFASIGSTSEVGPRLASSVNHDDRKGVDASGRNLELGVKLPAHRP